MSLGNDHVEEKQVEVTEMNGTLFMKTVKEKVAEMMKIEEVDEEATRTIARIIVLRVSTKHNNLWTRQLELKKKR